LCHFFFGVAIGNLIFKGSGYSTTAKKTSPSFKIELLTLLVILVLAYAWELLEFKLETGGAGQYIAYWFQGREHWANRLLSDPLLVLTGYLFSRKFQLFIWPARMVLIAWLCLFVFVFPHSMAYL